MVLRDFSLSQTGADETRSVPEWSTKHFEGTGRPLRIAVDQANWWYRNITAEKDAEMKKKSPGCHPREKRIMERIIYLLRMNIQLLFVFDGPKKHTRRWPSEYRYSESNIRFLKELLDQLGVPRHDAPGEAAAECVRLQELDIVNAIWTDDTDALMFGGSPTLVYFPNNKPDGDQFKHSNIVIVSAAEKRERANLTTKWFLMYAMLVGCSYIDGLEGFNAAKFFQLSGDNSFQAAANLLAAAAETPLVLSKWRSMVTSMIKSAFPNEDVATPSKTFPDWIVLEACVRPIVSPDQTLRDLPCLRDGWFRTYGPNMLHRYRFLLSNFNKQIHESWVARDLVPIQLNHHLRETPPGTQSENGHFGIEVRPKHKESPEQPSITTTITVDPLKVIPELLSAFPYEMYRIINGSRVKIQAPVFRPEEIELLDSVLRRGLSESELRKTLCKKPKRPPVPPPKNEHSRSFQPVMTRRTLNAPLRQKPALPPLSLNTHLAMSTDIGADTALSSLHTIDTTNSPSCIHFHQGLTLPGELEWHQPPLSSPLVLNPHPFSAHPMNTNAMSARSRGMNPLSSQPGS
ncbi:PIN domain-like protein [Xylaria nigripes]|nr:PIN domain-like protein [Xylaria nigripes]